MKKLSIFLMTQSIGNRLNNLFFIYSYKIFFQKLKYNFIIIQKIKLTSVYSKSTN